MKKQLAPRILLHSDLHLESGGFTLPRAPEDPAVLVLAGDLRSGGPDLSELRALSELPTVMVAGNHDWYGGDYFERLPQLRAQARQHNIHFLENQSVVVHGVRFLGATLWTDYGGGNLALMDYGLWYMNDHRAIKAARWWTAANKARFLRQFGQNALETFEGQFNPLLAFALHRKTRAWLKRELSKPFEGPTVVVSHHAPCFEALQRAGVSHHALNPESWVRRMKDDLNLTKVGSYASRILPEMHADLQRAGVQAWLFGHLHVAQHFAVMGIQVAANPRGRVFRPLTKDSARTYAFLGIRLDDADIEASRLAYLSNPEKGDGVGYHKGGQLDLNDSGYSVIEAAHLKALATIAERQAELKALRAIARSSRVDVADLAGHRADTLWAAILKAAREFVEDMAAQLIAYPSSSRDLQWLLSDCKLAKVLEFAGFESHGSFETCIVWRTLEEARTQEERELYGFRPSQYAAKVYLRNLEDRASQLMKALRKAPRAAAQLRLQYQRPHNYFLRHG